MILRFFLGLSLLVSTMGKGKDAGLNPCLKSLGDPNFFIYAQDASLDSVIRGSYPWSDSDGLKDFISRARSFIQSKKDLNLSQNVMLWEAFADRISFHVQGYMKNFKTTQRDGTTLFFSELTGPSGPQSNGKIFYYFAFTPDGSMFYGVKETRHFPLTSRSKWKENNSTLNKLK